MKIVAPLVITLGLSFLLYRDSKWNPIDVWPKSDYDAQKHLATAASSRAKMSGYTEEALKMYRARDESVPGWAKESIGQFQFGRGGQGKSPGDPLDVSN